MSGYTKISRKKFYKLGGFSNPRCVRISRGGDWAYFLEGN